MEPTILGIDPGTKEMGVAVLRDGQLLASGVHTLRNGGRPRDLIDQARRIVMSYVEEHLPTIVGIEEPLLVPTRRAALVSVIEQELHARSRELGLRVVELPPREIRRIVVGDPHATKIAVAEAIVRMGFQDLKSRIPRPPARTALGLRPRDKYWLHMFDALAVALACARSANGDFGRTHQRTGEPDRLVARHSSTEDFSRIPARSRKNASAADPAT